MVKVEINAETIGKAFAHSDDHEQATILNAMAKELHISMRGIHSTVETQHCYVSDKLDMYAQRMVADLAEFVRLRKEDKT